LRAGHDRDSENFDWLFPQEREQSLSRVGIEIAIHDRDFLASFKNGSNSQDRQGKAPVTGLGCFWVVENDHGRFLFCPWFELFSPQSND
jgi:hypothetical protein